MLKILASVVAYFLAYADRVSAGKTNSHIDPKKMTNLRSASLTLVVIFSIFLRFFRIKDFSIFGHDTVRDLLTVYKFIYFKEIIFRGPDFSEVWGYLSPLYYYILLPFYFTAQFNPLIPSILTLIANIIGLVLLMWIAYKIFGYHASIIGAIIYGFSFQVIFEASYGLNPAFLPPISLLAFYSIYQIFIERNQIYLIWFAFWFALLITFHLSGLFVIFPFIFFYICYKPKFKKEILIKSSIVLFVLAAIPYAIQEKKLAGWNIKQLFSFFTQNPENSNNGFNPMLQTKYFIEAIVNNILEVFTQENSLILIVISIFTILSLFYLFYHFIKYRSIQGFIGAYILIYLFSIGILTRFSTDNYRESWFYSVIIPIIILYLASLIFLSFQKIEISRIFVYLSLFVFVVDNLFFVVSYIPKTDNYSETLRISKILHQNANGREYDIYGTNAKPFYYLMWYYENNQAIKENYYLKLNWDQPRNSKLVYLMVRLNNLELNNKIDDIYKTHNLSTKSKIYSNREIEVYKLE